jgi:hypothetical protein
VIVRVCTTKSTLSSLAVSDDDMLDVLVLELLRCSVAGGIVTLLPAAMLVDAMMDLL